ncbi:MAG: ribonuclease D [Xanthomonadales bacterium]|jgi:ribonuclease D|nr:ribonuclease D [Xanthomonadales bacterium]
MPRTSLNRSIEAADRPFLLETAAQLLDAQHSWANSQLLGIDTEFVRERTYRAELGLVQVSDGETAWLVDTVRLESLEPLREMLEAPGVTKILHSVSEDLEVLYHTVAAIPAPLIDTQVACAFLGQPLQMGYHATVKWLFDIEVDKEQTRSNWCRRPLTERQLHYAAMDAVLLPEIATTLLARLKENGRVAWMQEEVERARKKAAGVTRPMDAWKRIRGALRLDDRALRALRQLAAWREERASSRNLARGFVAPDAGLLNLARARPTTKQGILAIEGIHAKVLERHADELLDALRRADEDHSPLDRPAPLDGPARRLLDALRDRVQKRAAELEIEPALLASRKDLERLLRAEWQGEEPPERFSGWRQTVITDDLLSIIR